MSAIPSRNWASRRSGVTANPTLAVERFLAPITIPNGPDGATVDSGGYVWSARYRGACVARIAPDGKLDRLVVLPVTQVTSCAFGGDDLRTLFITTARQGAAVDPNAATSLDGALFALRVDGPGLPEAAFRMRTSKA